ncbi:TPA: phage tail length tape measure family protein [Escherichia coli]|uniref:phage tail tape measure protein n=1 Tax=Escherichia coli TaxID=562 RepID=UPI000BE6B53E|nr:phage tail length tape measure family protein [Escherichia coli]HDQ6471457.1 phage tail tape measure protein [Escherichia coli O25 str. E39a]EFL6615666.1 phage tail tape measure protein [Escherichia coli]EFL9432055.1 phage tail tape measure protein [Escherichia coli]EFN7657681.1 phage tail tape measure protein [Escherichia coli]EFP0620229.1 phage tail tape measure protein [Escherichia coli]
MAQSVGDLIVNLDVDSTKFTEQVNRVNKQLKGTGQAANDAALQVQKSFTRHEVAAKRAGLSVGQYSNAMRMLPAQFTDVATQLAGGQNPWLILLQQGGQVKDMFGGIRPMLVGLASSISPVMLGVGALTAGTAALMYSYYQGSSTLSEFNKTLVLTGNTAGLTAVRMQTIAAAGEKAGLTFNQTSQALTALVNAGVRAGANFEGLAISVAKFTDASGLPVDKVAEAFGRMVNDPASGLLAMAQQFHNVTAEQVEYVAALQRSGNEAGALQAANEAATAGFNKQTASIRDNMGSIESAADSLKNAFKSMWDAALDIGRPDTSQEMLSKAEAAFRRADEIWDLRKGDRYVNDEARARFWNDRETARQALDMAQQQARNSQLAQESATREAGLEADRLKYAQQAQANYSKSQTALEKYTDRQNELNKALKEGRILQADYNINLAAARKEYEDSLKKPTKVRTPGGTKLTDSTSAQTLELQTQLEVLRQHTGINDKISLQRQQLWKEQAKFTVLEQAAKNRVLTDDEKSVLASKDKVLAQAEINAGLGDQIVIQERLNRLQDSSQKYVTQMGEKTRALADSAGMSSRQAQRRLEEAQLLQGWKNSGGNESDKGYQNELTALRNYYGQQDAIRQNWQAGALTSMANFADEASNYNLTAANAASSLLNQTTNSMANAFSGIITQAKSVGDAFGNMFSSMGETVIQTLSQMAAQWLVYQAVQLMVGKGTQASAAAAMTSNATASALMAQLNAYASTAAIPIVGPALAPAAMAAAAAVTSPMVAAISAASLMGMAHDGLDKVPATGTWLLQQGERVVKSNTSAKLDATLTDIQKQRENNAMQGQFNYSPTIQVNGDPDARTIAMMEAAVKRGATQGFDMVVNSLSKGQGKVHDAVNVMYAKRKAR